MAKEKEKKEEKPKAPKPKPVEKFYAMYANYHFCYPVIDEETGKPRIQTNPQTGNPVFDVDGNPRIVTKMEKFIPISIKMSAGFLSVAEYNPNDESKQNEARGIALRKLAAQDNIRVYTESDHEERTNHDAWIEKKRIRELQERLDAAESELKTYRDLDKQIAEIEGKG